MPASHADAGPSQLGGTSKPTGFGRVPYVRDPVFRNGPALPKFARALGQSSPEEVNHLLRGEHRTGPKRRIARAKTPVRRRTPVRGTTPDRGKAPMSQASPTSPPNCMVQEPYVPPPSRVASTRDPRTTSISCGRNLEQNTGSEPPPRSRAFGRRRRFPELHVPEHRIRKGQAIPRKR